MKFLKASIILLLMGFLSIGFIFQPQSATLQSISGAEVIEGVPTGFTFTKNLSFGMKDADVVYLKKVLFAEGCLSNVANTNYFASKTLAAVKCFQQKYKDVISEAAGYTIKVSGLVGAGTRVKLNAILAGTVPTTPTTPTGIPAGFIFTKTLKIGDVDSDVVYLKVVLTAEGCLSGVSNTTYFGSQTKAGVQCFQAKYGTGSLGTTGANTRVKLNEIITRTTSTPSTPICGDNLCNGIETCSTCSRDCGVCNAIYSLNVQATNGSVTKSPSQTTYTAGVIVTLTATPNSGYQFTGWSGNVTGITNPLSITMNSDKTITANFALITTGGGDGGGGIVVVTNHAPVLTLIGNKSTTTGVLLSFQVSATDSDGNTLTCSASNLPSGATFNTSTKTFSWTPSTTGTYTTTFTVSDGSLTDTETITITVEAPSSTYSLTTNATNGTVTKSPNQTTFSSGAIVTLTAAPSTGYSFTGWSGDLTGTTNQVTVTMNSNKTITASFTWIPVCGDLSCNGTETCTTCPGDCGACPTGHTYYLDINNPNCSNSGPGTSEQPWCDLNRAYTWYSGNGTKVQEGDTVLFKNGNYGTFEENTNDGQNRLVYRTDWVTYKAAPGHMPVLDNIDIMNADKWGNPRNDGDSYLKLEEFRVLNCASIRHTSYVQIKDCNITQEAETYEGLYAPYFWPGAAGISGINVHYLTIEDSEISNAYRGIEIKPDFNDPSDIIIRNNTCHHFGEDGIDFANAKNVVLENNKVYDIDSHRTTINLFGAITGNFSLGEPVVMEIAGGLKAEGIVCRVTPGTGYEILEVWQTGAEDFWEGTYSNPRGTIVTGPHGTLAINSTDPSHCDTVTISRCDGVIINGNYLNNGDGWALKLDSPLNLTVSNNLLIGSSCVIVAGTDNFDLINNTMYSYSPGDYNAGYRSKAILFYTSGDILRDSVINNMYNNIIDNLLQGTDGTVRARIINHGNNIFYSSKGNPIYAGGPAYPFVANNTELVNYDINSLFVDPANNDFRLKATSSAIDFGNPSYGPSADILGNPRVRAPDAGAYEYQGTPQQCASGQTQSCSTGLQGVCFSGTKTCQSSGIWGSCIQTTQSSAEICNDRLDNDCDGKTDCDDSDCSSNSACQPSIPTDYISYWKFDENVNDEKGINNGTIYGNPQYTSGVQGQGLNFNGNGDYVQIPRNSTLEPSSQITISAWVKVTGAGGSKEPNMVINHQHGADGYRIGYYSGGYFVFFAGAASNWSQASTLGTTLNPNAWYHIVGVYNGTNAQIFLNGVEKTPGSTQSGNILYQDLPIYFGRADISGYDFNGTIDNAIIYNRALSANEIRNLYNVQKPIASKLFLNNLASILSAILNILKDILGKIKSLF